MPHIEENLKEFILPEKQRKIHKKRYIRELLKEKEKQEKQEKLDKQESA